MAEAIECSVSSGFFESPSTFAQSSQLILRDDKVRHISGWDSASKEFLWSIQEALFLKPTRAMGQLTKVGTVVGNLLVSGEW